MEVIVIVDQEQQWNKGLQDSRHFHIIAGNWLTLYLPTPSLYQWNFLLFSILLKSLASFVAFLAVLVKYLGHQSTYF